MHNSSNAEISSDADKDDEHKYNEITQALTQPDTVDDIDEMDEDEDDDEIEDEEIGITNTNTEQMNVVDLRFIQIRILPEDEEIDMKAPEDAHHMITPPPSNQGTPISIATTALHERTLEFSQLRHLRR